MSINNTEGLYFWLKYIIKIERFDDRSVSDRIQLIKLTTLHRLQQHHSFGAEILWPADNRLPSRTGSQTSYQGNIVCRRLGIVFRTVFSGCYFCSDFLQALVPGHHIIFELLRNRFRRCRQYSQRAQCGRIDWCCGNYRQRCRQ